MSEPTTFSVRINGGSEQTLKCFSGEYQRAAAAAVAMLAHEKNGGADVVEIWVPDLLPDYGPYFFEIGTDAFGSLVVRTLIPSDGHSPGEVRRLR
ncbi:hypothetical protein J5277_09705 [Rhizobium sp. 16-449-1b]|uniref:hypothetical protein n=1 Tax=Rhizobium sp. 16-449-1b TaxID=2819989 RepID=UPI001ADA164C|nr:hypothetical protein [Rhizobium sp. 16-449-1b]MBO9194380.1 hypothetical protein [Rhizobium sp. 16-449-1b]